MDDRRSSCAGVEATTARQAAALAEVLQGNADHTVALRAGAASIGKVADTFFSYLAASGTFQVAPGTLATAPGNANGKLPAFATFGDYPDGDSRVQKGWPVFPSMSCPHPTTSASRGSRQSDPRRETTQDSHLDLS
ncbi:hypothetical protein WJX74_008043 [Apatococcus lobatus]|uniref:Uncharacterized protein n=1 Tax=Apatococcus lobatus TaxID=904363 RepID=A0AAW1SAZ1_9CHLO